MMYVILTHTHTRIYVHKEYKLIRYDVLYHMMCILYDVLCIMCYLLIMYCVYILFNALFTMYSVGELCFSYKFISHLQ